MSATQIATKEVKIVEVSLPKDFMYLALQAIVGVDAAFHILHGFGVTSSLFGAGTKLLTMGGAMHPASLAWGLIMLIVALLVFKEAKIK